MKAHAVLTDHESYWITDINRDVNHALSSLPYRVNEGQEQNLDIFYRIKRTHDAMEIQQFSIEIRFKVFQDFSKFALDVYGYLLESYIFHALKSVSRYFRTFLSLR